MFNNEEKSIKNEKNKEAARIKSRLVSYDYKKLIKEIELSDNKGNRLRAGSTEYNNWLERHNLLRDSHLIVDMMAKELPFMKVTILGGESEGFYIYSMKNKVAFYFQTEIEHSNEIIDPFSLSERVYLIIIYIFVLFGGLGSIFAIFASNDSNGRLLAFIIILISIAMLPHLIKGIIKMFKYKKMLRINKKKAI